ncbi:MAG: NAD(P)-dependent oxidoreductase [Rhodospirillaceae bacterium]
MTKIAFFGLGAMGSRMVTRLLAAGHSVTVWNRTAEAALPLVQQGATQAATPAEAARGATMVLAMLRDDQASRAVWLDPDNGALSGMVPGTLAVEMSTLSLDWVAALAKAVQEKGGVFADAPLAGSRPQAEAGALIFFTGATPEVQTLLEPVLRAMGQAVHAMGPVGSGMAAKLAVNGLFGAQLAILGEVLALGQRNGLVPEQLLAALAQTPVLSPASQGAGQAMCAGQFAPQFPIALVAKDFGYVLDAAGPDPAALPLLAATAERYRAADSQGLGGQNITALASLVLDLAPTKAA